jgi:hypothetical protein
MKIELVAGSPGNSGEVAGIGAMALFDGLFGITFDVNESFAFITESTGRSVRKMSLQSASMSHDVTRKLLIHNCKVLKSIFH